MKKILGAGLIVLTGGLLGAEVGYVLFGSAVYLALPVPVGLLLGLALWLGIRRDEETGGNLFGDAVTRVFHREALKHA